MFRQLRSRCSDIVTLTSLQQKAEEADLVIELFASMSDRPSRHQLRLSRN
jgi:hypothetical protein